MAQLLKSACSSCRRLYLVLTTVTDWQPLINPGPGDQSPFTSTCTHTHNLKLLLKHKKSIRNLAIRKQKRAIHLFWTKHCYRAFWVPVMTLSNKGPPTCLTLPNASQSLSYHFRSHPSYKVFEVGPRSSLSVQSCHLGGTQSFCAHHEEPSRDQHAPSAEPLATPAESAPPRLSHWLGRAFLSP